MEQFGKNTLYPIFLKLHELNLLIIGGGPVGLEKATFILKNSPDANITLLGEIIHPEIYLLAQEFPKLKIRNKSYELSDLDGFNLLILATNNIELDKEIKVQARLKNILLNVADIPELCDFYLGSIISRGDLKIAISTNGKSPTLSKRIRQYLEEALPDSTQQIIDNLQGIRNKLSGDFNFKLNELNNITQVLSSDSKQDIKPKRYGYSAIKRKLQAAFSKGKNH